MALFWLSKIGLIEYEMQDDVNNLGESVYCICLKKVNYYTNGGEVGKALQSSENQKMTEKLKQTILNMELVDFESL